MFAIVFEGSQKYVVREKNDHLSLVAQTRVMLYKMKLFTLYHFSICSYQAVAVIKDQLRLAG